MMKPQNIRLIEKILMKKNKNEKYFKNDPIDSKCPYCGEHRKPCSHINSLARAWARGACKRKHNK